MISVYSSVSRMSRTGRCGHRPLQILSNLSGWRRGGCPHPPLAFLREGGGFLPQANRRRECQNGYCHSLRFMHSFTPSVTAIAVTAPSEREPALRDHLIRHLLRKCHLPLEGKALSIQFCAEFMFFCNLTLGGQSLHRLTAVPLPLHKGGFALSPCAKEKWPTRKGEPLGNQAKVIQLRITR